MQSLHPGLDRVFVAQSSDSLPASSREQFYVSVSRGRRQVMVFTDDLGCFGWLRGVRDRSVMLEMRRKDGHVLAVGYGWLERVEYRPESGILLHLPGRAVTIRGWNLNAESRPTVRLFQGIVRHRVPWIAESATASDVLTENGGTVIESIEW